ncbi:MAG TPA: periplasmic heavy metal sensor [Nitrospiraceae bacterium]|jgi:DNA-binding MarR family transcriptional regulator|nr:periplasmic heavy metal sensor [Nitrospiraceae bacterium]
MLSPRPILVAVISVFIVLVVVHDADARKRVDGRMFTPDQLYGYCTEYGGQYWPPGLGGAYACVLPDGTLIVCGGDFPYYCVESRTLDDRLLGLSEAQVKNITMLATDYEKHSIRTEAEWDLAEVEVQALIRDEKSDMGAIEQALKKSEAARTALRQTGVKTSRAVSAVLTPEQREKWRNRIHMQLTAKGQERFMPGGHYGAGESADRR